jgi:hypothetical protein
MFTEDMKLFQTLDDARFVFYWKEEELLVVWFGGNQLNVVNYAGQHLDCWTNSELTKDKKSTRQIIKEHVELIQEEQKEEEEEEEEESYPEIEWDHADQDNWEWTQEIRLNEEQMSSALSGGEYKE